MRITRLYHPDSLQCGETIQLNTATSNHLIRVLRTKIDTPLILFNGDGHDYYCRTLDNNARNTLVTVESRNKTNRESRLNITLIQGLSGNDKMDYCIQKSVELGVNKIIPVICARSSSKLSAEKRHKKLSHWRRIVISACEQCGRNVIPEISEITTFNELIARLKSNALKLVLAPNAENSLAQTVFDSVTTDDSIEVFIGPEGGLSEEELQLLQNLQFQGVKFGPRILRTETAGPAVISALQVTWGDF